MFICIHLDTQATSGSVNDDTQHDASFEPPTCKACKTLSLQKSRSRLENKTLPKCYKSIFFMFFFAYFIFLGTRKGGLGVIHTKGEGKVRFLFSRFVLYILYILHILHMIYISIFLHILHILHILKITILGQDLNYPTKRSGSLSAWE